MHKPNIGGSAKAVTTAPTRELEGARVSISVHPWGNPPERYGDSTKSFQQMLQESQRQGMTLREFERRLALRKATTSGAIA